MHRDHYFFPPPRRWWNGWAPATFLFVLVWALVYTAGLVREEGTRADDLAEQMAETQSIITSLVEDAQAASGQHALDLEQLEEIIARLSTVECPAPTHRDVGHAVPVFESSYTVGR